LQDNDPGWTVDVGSLSEDQLVEMLDLLKDSKHKQIQLAIRHELIIRAKKIGLTDRQIIDSLLRGVPTGIKWNNIASDWAGAIGLTIQEFKRLASGK